MCKQIRPQHPSCTTKCFCTEGELEFLSFSKLKEAETTCQPPPTLPTPSCCFKRLPVKAKRLTLTEMPHSESNWHQLLTDSPEIKTSQWWVSFLASWSVRIRTIKCTEDTNQEHDRWSFKDSLCFDRQSQQNWDLDISCFSSQRKWSPQTTHQC